MTLHECVAHYIVVRRFRDYVVIRYLCLHTNHWYVDVMTIAEIEELEAFVPIPIEYEEKEPVSIPVIS